MGTVGLEYERRPCVLWINVALNNQHKLLTHTQSHTPRDMVSRRSSVSWAPGAGPSPRGSFSVPTSARSMGVLSYADSGGSSTARSLMDSARSAPVVSSVAEGLFKHSPRDARDALELAKHSSMCWQCHASVNTVPRPPQHSPGPACLHVRVEPRCAV